MADNSLDFVLKFLIDKNSQTAAKKALADVSQPVKTPVLGDDWQNVAGTTKEWMRDFGVSADEAAQKLEGMGVVNMRNRDYILQSVDAYEQLGIEAGITQKAIEQTAESTHEMSQTGQRSAGMMTAMTGVGLMFTGMQIQQYGQALLQPIAQYVKYAGQASSISADWLENQRRLEQSAVRIGKNMAEVVAPFEKAKADVAELISQSKTLSAIGAGVGAAASVAGPGLMLGGQALSAFGAMQSVKYLKEMGETSRAAAVASTAATVAKKVETGTSWMASQADIVESQASYNAAAANTAQATASRGVTAGLLTFGKVVGGIALAIGGVAAAGLAVATIADNIKRHRAGEAMPDQGGMIWKDGKSEVAELGNTLERLGLAAQSAASDVDGLTGTINGVQISQGVLDAFISYQKQQQDATEQYERARTDIVEQHSRERVALEQQYMSARAKMVRDFGRSQAEALADMRYSQAKRAGDIARSEREAESSYYARRRKLLEDYHIDLQRMEEDHQRRMRQRQATHNDRVTDLIDQRDAMGLFRQERDYERERAQAEEEYSVTAARRNEDLARRLAEMESEFAQQRAKRMQEAERRRAEEEAEFQRRQARERERFEERLVEFDAQHKEQLKQMDAQKRERLQILDRQFKEEQAKRRAQFFDQIRDLDAALLGETTRKKQWYDLQTKLLDSYIAAWKQRYSSNLLGYSSTSSTTGVRGSRSTGGYVRKGLWQLHDDEYVLNAQTTRMMEQQAGGMLTQGKVQAMMTMNANRQNITVAPVINIAGVLDQGMTRKIYRIAKQATVDAVAEALR